MLAQMFPVTRANRFEEMTIHGTKTGYIMTGAFPDAGKATAMGELATRLSGRGFRGGLMPITRDVR